MQAAKENNTIITVADHLSVSESMRVSLIQWPVLLKQIEARSLNGFITTRLVISGVTFRNGKPFAMQVHVDYVDSKGRKGSKPFIVKSDTAVLLFAFRVVDQEVSLTKRPKIDAYSVIMVKQARWATNTADSLEIPGGGIEADKNPKIGAWREFCEEVNCLGLLIENNPFTQITPRHIQSLGNLIRLHPHDTESEHQFSVTWKVTLKDLSKIKKAICCRAGGLGFEQEYTQSLCIPLEQAWRESLTAGNSPHTVIALTRYMKKHNLL